MKLSAFPISFWGSVGIRQMTDALLEDWVEAGFTLLPSPGYTAEDEDIRLVKTFLDKCEASGLKVMLFDPRVVWSGRTLTQDENGTYVLNEAAYAAGVREAHAQLGSHPAVLNYYIGDEPGAKMYASMCACSRIAKQITGKEGYINLYPYYPTFYSNTGCRDYDAYLKNFLRDSGTGILSHDYYAQLLEGGRTDDEYYYVLKCHYDAAKASGAEIWHTVLSSKHFDRRVPDYNDFRFEINAALAYGAKEISYFGYAPFMNADSRMINCMEGPVDWWWEKTDTYSNLRKANRELHQRWGDIFLQLQPDRVTHFPLVPHTYARPLPRSCVEPFTPDGRLYSLSIFRGLAPQHLIVSNFTHTVTGDKYVFIVNANTAASVGVTAVFENASAVMRYDALGREYTALKSPDGKPGRLRNPVFWLAPGQGELHRIVR